MALRYAAGVTIAHILAVTEVVLIMTSLRPETTGGARALFRDGNSTLIVAVVVLALAVVAAGSVAIIWPSLGWFLKKLEPDARQRRRALHIARSQSLLLLAVWALSGIVTVLANLDQAPAVAMLIGPAVFFGATAAVCTAMLLTMRTLRPIAAATGPNPGTRDTAPGVLARLITMWVLCCALPNLGITLLIVARSHGIAIDTSASVEVPVLVMSGVAILWGLRAIILVSRSISDPVRQVVDAMSDVERGDIGRNVEVYERSEIGRLQSGFNRMVTGLRERDRLRDLFSRHVGADVVTLLVQRDKTLYRDVRDVAVLFVDLTGSTEFAAARGPQEVADTLNLFFQTVVAAVDHHHGCVNTFQGDAALAVFGSPIHNASAASDALATARDLAHRMRAVTAVDFGIGVSAGSVFAGYLGALNRFEYTVVGDPVNEAARLADRAKTLPERVACSGAALDRAGDDELKHWRAASSEILRGRAQATEISVPVD
ncbi:adenylate/guanylate cyclase domain-containing protein [soil metagenome]